MTLREAKKREIKENTVSASYPYLQRKGLSLKHTDTTYFQPKSNNSDFSLSLSETADLHSPFSFFSVSFSLQGSQRARWGAASCEFFSTQENEKEL